MKPEPITAAQAAAAQVRRVLPEFTYSCQNHSSIDECVSWGDYFYMEALTRLAGDWAPYW